MIITNELKNAIRDEIKRYFLDVNEKKVNGTPLEAFDVVNKTYVDNKTGARMSFDSKTLSSSDVLTLLTGTLDYSMGVTVDGSTGKFTIVSSGYYLIVAVINWANDSGNTYWEANLYKNGSSSGRLVWGRAGNTELVLIDRQNLSAGDYLQMYAQVTTTNFAAVTGSWFFIVKV